MQEDGAAKRRNRRIIIIAQLHDDIVDMVFQPEILVAGRIGQLDPAIVERVFRRIAPAVFRGQRHKRQQGFRGVQPVGPVEDAAHGPGAGGGKPITFPLVLACDDTATPDRTPGFPAGQQEASISKGNKIGAHGTLPLL